MRDIPGDEPAIHLQLLSITPDYRTSDGERILTESAKSEHFSLFLVVSSCSLPSYKRWDPPHNRRMVSVSVKTTSPHACLSL